MHTNTKKLSFNTLTDEYKDPALFLSAALLMAFVGSFAFEPQALAAMPDKPEAAQMADSRETAPPNRQARPPTNSERMKRTEDRIATLHNKLQITDAQTAAWETVAQVMRTNEAEISQLIYERHENPQSMSAIDDLNSYVAITQAHADASKRLLAAFQPLYSAMSPKQMKEADNVFGVFEGHPNRKPTKTN